MYIYIYIKDKVQDVNTLNFRKRENNKNDFIFIKKNVLFTSKRKLKIKLREENILSLMLWSKFKV